MFVVETSTGIALSGLHSALAGIVANIGMISHSIYLTLPHEYLEPDGIITTQY